MQAAAFIGVVGLHVADDAVGRVDGQAAEVVQGPGLAGLDGDARVGVGGAVGRFVAQQAGLFVPRAQGPGLRALPPALPRGQLAQLVGRGRQHRARGGHLLAAAQVGPGRPGGLFFPHRFERRVGLDGRGVDGLRIAGDQAAGRALGKDVVEQALEHGGRKQLAGAAHGRVPGQFLVHPVAPKQQDVQPQGTVLDQAAVADQVFQAADEHELEEHHRVQRGLPGVAVEAPRRVVEKRPVHPLGQPPVQIMAWHPLGKPKAGHLFVEKQLLALHLLFTTPGSATATVGR